MTANVIDRLFRRILVPHDFSDHATRGLEIAVGLAGAESVVTVLHAMTPVYSAMGGPAADLAWAPTPEMIADVKRQLVRSVERALGSEAASRVRCRVVLSDPLSAILAAARSADVIVMTTLGRTGLSHLLMGSVAEKVVRHATIPVLTVHPKSARRFLGGRARPVATPRKPAKRRLSAR
jgi:universal stress protein A